ncbi:putative DNA-binding domain-containing protein [Shimia sp. R11_0]|uniref:HvfC/BufC N-terminal domain-containing protein n=1 Tax=Shimia sp. R11_0 TaxID=2821096 RepID=UPI001ADB08CF|nr:DNA-binding domain-containing protein [Shimia sp. R11_0]MBO9479209.1 putative DNA-binding domain-containing protein [Shimia sp. R11_0]
MTVTQTTFRDAIFDGAQERPLGLSDAIGQPAGRRFDVYRNNVAVSLSEALATGFPTIAKLLGEENFNAIAGIFLRQFPPTSPMMIHYGADFPTFLESFEPLAHLGYLGDVARLELGLRRSYHAADSTGVAPETLAEIPQDKLVDITANFAPAVSVQRSLWPIHAIWAFNMQDGPKPTAVAQDVLILRPEYDPLPHVLPPGAYECVTALMAGAKLGTAAEFGTEADEGFDLGATLGLLLTGNALTSFDVPS